ncbi:endomembrane protein 70-like protein [Sarocladium implicatum]|nr:endomembrane protein 70-like protein [Sarocladium implicatum]
MTAFKPSSMSTSSHAEAESLPAASAPGLHMKSCTFAHHDGVALACDIYSSPKFPQNFPVFLYFHAGGLVGWNRRHVPPWLVQACHQRKWTLISADYRFLPQAGGRKLAEDAKAAYAFASHFNTPFGKSRRVIVGGSSAGPYAFPISLTPENSTDLYSIGFFLACTLARDRSVSLKGPLLSICGIPSFQHPFFSSSNLLTDEPISEELVRPHEEGPVIAWAYEEGDPDILDLKTLNSDGSKNNQYVRNSDASPHNTNLEERKRTNPALMRRGMLWAYYVYQKLFPSLIGAVDSGFADPAKDNQHHRLAWPRTIVVHGDADKDFPLEGSMWMKDAIGEDRVQVFVAKGQDHLFELGCFLEDEGEAMDVLRDALRALDRAVAEMA